MKMVAPSGVVLQPAQPECVIPRPRASGETCRLKAPLNRRQGTPSSCTWSIDAVEYPPVSLSEPMAQFCRIESGVGNVTMGRTEE